MYKWTITWTSFFITLFILGCVSTPPFDQTEYDRAITLKIDALSLLEKASRDYQLYQDEVSKIRKDMAFLLEYAKRKPNNEGYIALMNDMYNPEGSLLGKILKEWELQGTLGKAYAEGFSSIISDSFDEIIDLLGNRIKK